MKHAGVLPIFVVAVLSVTTTTASAAPPHAATIQAHCNEMQSKVLSGDVEGALTYVFPRLVKLIGGPEKMTSYLREGAATVHKMGATLTCSAPTQYSQAGSRSFALLLVLLSSEVVDAARAKNHFKQSSSMLAISEDHGATWLFMAITDQGVPDLLIPGGIGKLHIPPKDPGAWTRD